MAPRIPISQDSEILQTLRIDAQQAYAVYLQQQNDASIISGKLDGILDNVKNYSSKMKTFVPEHKEKLETIAKSCTEIYLKQFFTNNCYVENNSVRSRRNALYCVEKLQTAYINLLQRIKRENKGITNSTFIAAMEFLKMTEEIFQNVVAPELENLCGERVGRQEFENSFVNFKKEIEVICGVNKRPFKAQVTNGLVAFSAYCVAGYYAYDSWNASCAMSLMKSICIGSLGYYIYKHNKLYSTIEMSNDYLLYMLRALQTISG